MNKKKYTIFFGAAGAAKAYVMHTSIIPDYYIDNDQKKWEKKIDGVEIKPPFFLKNEVINRIDKIVITTGYVKSVLPQLLSFGIDRNLIEVPAKALLGQHPFINEKNKIESAEFLNILMNTYENICVVAAGGTALGFYRDSDFIKWDFDFDMFASLKYKNKLVDLLEDLKCSVTIENNEIKTNFKLSTGELVPASIKFFDPEKLEYKDIYEDYVWNWPTSMFINYKKILIHNFKLNIPNPPEIYLEGIYGKSWNKPNPEFSYHDYGSD